MHLYVACFCPTNSPIPIHPSISNPHVSSEGAGVDPSRHRAKEGERQPATQRLTRAQTTVHALIHTFAEARAAQQ